MQSLEIQDVVLQEDYKVLLLKANYTTLAEVLTTPPLQLSRRLKLPLVPAIHDLLITLSQSLRRSNSPRTISSILELDATGEEGKERSRSLKKDWISSGDVGIDALLGGGVRIGGITEIAGQSASGKSHLCLQLSLTAQLPSSLSGQSGGTILISSEGLIPSSRLLDISRHLIACLPDGIMDEALNEWDFLDNVHVEKAVDVENLEALLGYIAPARIERVNRAAREGSLMTPYQDGEEGEDQRTSPPKPPLPIRLIIIDSIAAPFRVAHENDSAGFINRAKEFGTIGDLLKKLAKRFGVAVVVVNQVSDVFDNGRPDELIKASHSLDFTHPASINTSTSNKLSSDQILPAPPGIRLAHETYNFPSYLYSRYQSPHFSGQSNSSQIQAALGHTWSNIINVRIMMSLLPSSTTVEDKGQEKERGKRKMELIFSPFARRAEIEYVVERGGIRSFGEPRFEQ